MKRPLYYGIILVTFLFALALHFSPAHLYLRFGSSILSLLMMASLLGKATESVAHYAGQRIGGFLNATFGNAAELIISIFLIKEGLFTMVKASITGSIIGNLLLVLGLSVLMGGVKYPFQTFNVRIAGHNATLMLLGVIALFIPAIFFGVFSGKDEMNLSLVTAVLLILVYLLWLIFSMITHKVHLSEEESEQGEPMWGKGVSILMLALATIGVAIVSEWIVSTVEDVALQLGWSELFIGAFLIAIVGNAAEHAAAITLAMKNRIGASVEIAIGSSLQIALFVAPLLVLISLLFGKPMDLLFMPVELGAIGVAVFIASSISRDGETNWFEGVLLLAVYAILGTAFFFV
ncbi:calcium/proton exchanger [Thermicanus aegyptius]|uniref:calcium/proton exchanger n=1 Tax=Thermicanus aegyptius TaxID=94009 RepID=UPI00040A1148|nr:calcium/proton exchanger [Thermicanus aegyptius]